jgi:hypothetical protein
MDGDTNGKHIILKTRKIQDFKTREKTRQKSKAKKQTEKMAYVS